MRRAAADPIDGVLALDKPPGLSSNAALQQARRLLQARKAGHTGTLDPLASGLLPLTFGEATKFSADLLDADKEYEATLALGVRTASGDAEGEVLERRAVEVTRADFEAVLARFTGEQQQVPPMHSALKRDGRPLYELARAGREVERAARTVRIGRLALLEWDASRPRVAVACSKGTYVRVLAQDIGAALGCGAHLGALRRTRVGPLGLEQAATLEALQALSLEARRARLAPVDYLLAGLPRADLDEASARRFAQGQRVPFAADGAAQRRRVYAGGRLLGVARAVDAGLEPERLLALAPAPGPATVPPERTARGRQETEFGIKDAT
jgi:tRNA pseudouridine55 synthase